MLTPLPCCVSPAEGFEPKLQELGVESRGLLATRTRATIPSGDSQNLDRFSPLLSLGKYTYIQLQ